MELMASEGEMRGVWLLAFFLLVAPINASSMAPTNEDVGQNTQSTGGVQVLVAPEYPGNSPNAFDPWGSPPPLNPFEASPYMPHPTAVTKMPQAFYHPMMGPLYQAVQMHTTPGFIPFLPHQFSAFYNPITSPSSQALFHPLLNPVGINVPTGDMRPLLSMMAHNPSAYTALTSPGVVEQNARQQAVPTLNWVAPGGF